MKVYWYCILLFIEKNSLVAEAVFKHLSQLCRKENIWPYQRNDIWAYTYYCLNFKKISQYWIATASTGICSKCRCCLGMKKKDVGWRGVPENMIEKDPYWWHMVLVPSGCWFVKSSRVIRQDVLVWYIVIVYIASVTTTYDQAECARLMVMSAGNDLLWWSFWWCSKKVEEKFWREKSQVGDTRSFERI